MISEYPSFNDNVPDYELAGSLQATLDSVPTRDFSLDLQQSEAIIAIGEALLDGTKTGYVNMATSTGKTAIESLVADAAVRAGKRVLMLAPSKEIAAQLSGSGSESPTGLQRFTSLNQTANIRNHFGGQRANKQADVVISTYSGFLNDYKNNHIQLGKFDVVLADECHRSLGEQTSKALGDAFPEAVKLGFSATPDYAIDRQSAEVYDTLLYEFSLLHAVERGKTAPVRAMLYETDDVITTIDYRNEFSDAELAPLAHSHTRNATALELAQTFVGEGRQGIIACIPGEKNFHARLLANLLRQRGLRAADVGSHLTDDERTAILKQYEAGELDILTFTRALEEGWDSAAASFALNLAPTTSPVRTTQLLGRILRKKTDDCDSVYVDFLDKKAGITNKSQYLAMHALDLEYIDFTRVLGRGSGESIDWHKRPLLSVDVLSANLRTRLMGLQGKALKDIVVPQQINPLQKEWDDRLSAEGLSDKIEYNDVLPQSLNRRLEKAYKAYVDLHGEPPAQSWDLLEFMNSIERRRVQAMGSYGLRVLMDVIDEEALTSPDAHEEVVYTMLQKHIAAILDTISMREADIISMRFDLPLGEELKSRLPKDYSKQPVTYGDIAKIYGITANRVREVAGKAMMKLSCPPRAQVLSGYLRDELDVRSKPSNQQPPANYFLRMFEKFEPIAPFQPIPLTKFVLSDVIRSSNPYLTDDTYKHPSEWRDVVPVCEALGMSDTTGVTFDRQRAALDQAIETTERAIRRVSGRPIANGQPSHDQRQATLDVYKSRVDFLRSMHQQLSDLYTFLEENDGITG